MVTVWRGGSRRRGYLVWFSPVTKDAYCGSSSSALPKLSVEAQNTETSFPARDPDHDLISAILLVPKGLMSDGFIWLGSTREKGATTHLSTGVSIFEPKGAVDHICHSLLASR